jgi:hypothetical protein
MPQPSTTGMVIPKASELSLSQIKDLFITLGEDFEKTFDKQTKKQINVRYEELGRQELQVKYQQKIENILKPPEGFKKIQMKLGKYYDKWFVKRDFLKTLGGFFKKLIDRAGGWLKTLLEILLFFAIFDPGGSMLNGIFNMLTDLIIRAVNFIIPKIPGIVKRMWKLFWDVVVPEFGKLGKALGEALFGKGALADFMGKLGELFPIFTAVGGAISYLLPALSFLFSGLIADVTAAWLASSGFFATAAALWAVIWPVLAVIAAIVALVAVLYLVYKYWGVIKQFFADLWRMFNEASVGIKAIVVCLINVLLVLLTPVFVAIISAVVTGAIALWSFIVPLLVGLIPALITGAIALWAFLSPILLVVIPILLIVAAIYFLIKYSKQIDAWFKKAVPRFKKWLSGITQSFLDWWKNFSFKDLFSKLIDSIFGKGTSSKIGKVMDYISDILTSISDWITAFFSDPTAFLSPFGDNRARRDAAITSARMISASKDVNGDGINSIAGAAGVSASAITQGDVSKLAKILLDSRTADQMAQTRTDVASNITTTKSSKKFDKDGE